MATWLLSWSWRTEVSSSTMRNCVRRAARRVRGRSSPFAHAATAADALDYIYENYSLQHLEIKPEESVARRQFARSGRLRLIKNLSNAPPRSSRLRPSTPPNFSRVANRHSDHYSLAIVYMRAHGRVAIRRY